MAHKNNDKKKKKMSVHLYRGVLEVTRSGMGFVVVESLHLERCETYPSVAVRTAADKAAPFPPGADQGFVDSLRVAVKLELEIDPLHPVTTTLMRAGRLVVMDDCHPDRALQREWRDLRFDVVSNHRSIASN